ncbi:NAD-dependent epimerase/dehydratase family protein [Ktedonobacter robiniae]|nr:NAD(P)-dependent oxidoreductase [Ktedonobacter robiniae]
MDSHQTSSHTRILLTGAAGKIGSAFFAATSSRYMFRLADKAPLTLPEELVKEHEVITLDIADPLACQEACRDIDIVVHLAADPSPEADFYSSLLPNNIQGVYNIFRAAKDQGCQRVVLASSVHVFSGYAEDIQGHIETPVRPGNMYGVSKCFGEAVATYFAHSEGLSSIAIRIGAYTRNGVVPEWMHKYPDPRGLSVFLSERDFNQLLSGCIETPNIPFAIVHGISDNHLKRLNINSTRELVGYAPQDDAFDLFEEILQAWLQNK